MSTETDTTNALRLAAEHLQRLGYAIVATNAPTSRGTIDIVAHKDATLVIVDVKSRRVGRPPETGPGPGHEYLLRTRAATWLTATFGAPDRPAADDLRFDAIGITTDRHGDLVSLDHLQGAF